MVYRRKTKQISWRDRTIIDEVLLAGTGLWAGLYWEYGGLAFWSGAVGLVAYLTLKGYRWVKKRDDSE